MQAKPQLLEKGDFAPWFKAPAVGGASSYTFHTVGGRYVLMLFFGSAAGREAQRALRLVEVHRGLFDDENACFFGVSTDPEDVTEGRIMQQLPGLRFFMDEDRSVSVAYGASAESEYRAHWLLLDRELCVAGRFTLEEGEAAIQALEAAMAAPHLAHWAPIAVVPDVFEHGLCRALIQQYEQHGGERSGFMREENGKTVLVHDDHHKQRRDHLIEDERLKQLIAARINRRLVPAIQKVFQFRATRMERYLVACYEAGAGHFRPHRDNTTGGTAHRRFAVTINLNAEEYKGGDLRFPEFGNQTYRAPTGGAVVFSCSLLHEATPVTEGKRYAFVPFLYDEEAARIREANNANLGQGTTQYRR